MFASVAGEVSVVAIDHRQARAHEPGQVEDRDAGAEREGGVGVACHTAGESGRSRPRVVRAAIPGRGAPSAEGYFLPLQSGRGHCSQPQPVHAFGITPRF